MSEDDSSRAFEYLLDFLKRSRGFDFGGYKRTSLRRRIDKRMRTVQVESYEAYRDFLELHPGEFVGLFNSVLINVTSFFHDPEAWEFLQEEVMPRQLRRIGPHDPIRVWSTGCASGEEAYSAAIMLAELLGTDEFTRRVKVYGTDVDEDALQVARQASYSDRDTAGIPEELRARYFEPNGDSFKFRSDLRRPVIFGRLDVLRDAPISRLTLLLCRNTLMYFNAETQAVVCRRLHFALNDGGVLMLGRAETLLSQAHLFEPTERTHRIFAKTRGDDGADRRHDRPQVALNDRTGAPDDVQEKVHQSVFRTLPVAALLLDEHAALIDVNERGRDLLGIFDADLGAPLQDLDISYRPVDLRTPVNEALSDLRTPDVVEVELALDGARHLFDVEVMPLRDGTAVYGVCMFFLDRTEQRELENQLQVSTLELEQAYQELQTTNEELETTNEELQSAIEELETTNEELQSTNEELETMNEELQSTNDEFHAVNEELRLRSDEVEHLNRYLQAILASFPGGVVVLDSERKVVVWNAPAADLWGLRADEVTGADFLTLDIGLPVSELRVPIEETLAGRSGYEERSLEALTRRGRTVTCKVSINPLLSGDARHGVMLIMEVVAGE